MVMLSTSGAKAQLQTSVVTGVVLAPDDRPAPKAQVVLSDGLGNAITATEADGDGRFSLHGVAPGSYELRARTASLRSSRHRIVVSHGLPVSAELRLSPLRSESVAVEAGLDEAGTAGTTIAGDAVRRSASSLRSNVVRLAVAQTPGWTSEDNGLVHYHGADDGLLFVLDGIPIYERLDPQFGLGGNALATGSVRVLSGHVPAEFGLRSGGVVEVRSLARTDDAWSAFVETGVGGDGNQALSGLAQAPLGAKATLILSLGGERSRRFLDPVSLDNFHNTGHTGSGDARLVWTPTGSVLTAHAGRAQSSFDVPNDALQAEAGQDQRQKLAQTFATLNWQRAWSAASASQLAIFGRRTSGALSASAFDTPISAIADRHQDRAGILGALTQQRGRHRIKAGFEASWLRLEEEFSFVVTDVEAGFSEAALEHTADNPFAFSGRVERPLTSLYVQDAWRVADRLTLDAGLRYDRARLLVTESHWSPRVGASYRAGKATFRASVDRFFQPPQTEYLLLASSPEARVLSPFASETGAGGADLPAERTTALEAGVDLRLGAVNVGLAAWRRWIRSAGDPNVFFGTSIVFPNSVHQGRARGLDVRLELPRRGHVAGFLGYTLAKVDQLGPIDGGLFLEDDFIEIGPGTQFTPDHDQRHALSAELRYADDARGRWISIHGRYRSGTPLQVPDDEIAEIAERDGAELVDFAQARTKPYWVFDAQVGARLLRRKRIELSGRVSALNVAGARYAFNFGNPFSGTHFGAPRTIRADLRLALR